MIKTFGSDLHARLASAINACWSSLLSTIQADSRCLRAPQTVAEYLQATSHTHFITFARCTEHYEHSVLHRAVLDILDTLHHVQWRCNTMLAYIL